jgi:hypothetical protein
MFACEPGPVVGGYGDRIVGLIAVRVMAKLLNREFQILWTRDDLSSYFEYSAFDHEKLKPYDAWFRNLRMIDQPRRIAEHLRTSPSPLAEPGDFKRTDLLGVSISVNTETAQYLFQNPRIVNRGQARAEYLRVMKWAYQTLHTEVLKPTPRVLKRMQEVVGDRTGLVGIQIRAGDAFMKTGTAWDKRTQYLEGEAGVKRTLENIRARLDPTVMVFVTGDHPQTVKLAREVFGEAHVLGDDEPAQHLDRRQAEKLDQTKLYSDALILAQRCSELHISSNSNFGRVAALAGGVETVYGLDGQPLSTLELFSKTRTVFD